jgi:ech hydrogenase subunit A
LPLILFLILFPLVPAGLVLFTKHGKVRNVIVIVSVLALAVPSIYLLVTSTGPAPVYSPLIVSILNKIILFSEIGIAVLLCIVAIRSRRWWILLLVIPQSAFLFYFEIFHTNPFGAAESMRNVLSVDYFSLLMALIVSVIGGLVLIFSLNYMKEYHAHRPGTKDRSNVFFALFFLFFSAMYGIVFSNHLLWMLFFWEVTTLVSFFLIGYPGTEEAKRNAGRALLFNLLGGIAFTAAIGIAFFKDGIVELQDLITRGPAIAMIPAVLLCVAGMTKAAQLPFSSWLKGAMVAPTPVSALLHSSTMVKAGVFLIIKLSPVFTGSLPGLAIALIGALTFLIAAFIAISCRDAKEVLAWSTVSNLGLIVLCAGVGSAEAVWAAVLLLIFHAAAKALLFLSVGLIEHRLGSRDIESMDGLVRRLPKVTYILLVGIAGMFLAPFGMLISKWAALKALIDVQPVLGVIVIFGGTATLFFWTKWLGKLTSAIGVEGKGDTAAPEKQVKAFDWTALGSLAALTIGLCLLFPLVSTFLVDPYIAMVYQRQFSMNSGNILIMLVMLGMLLVLPVIFMIGITRGRKKMEYFYTDGYLSGANTRTPFRFFAAQGQVKKIETQNYYLKNIFGEKRLAWVGTWLAVALLVCLGGALFL